MSAIAPQAILAANVGPHVYQPAPTATVDMHNAPIIRVTAREPIAASGLYKRAEYVLDPCRPICELAGPCFIPQSMRDAQVIEPGLVWTSFGLGFIRDTKVVNSLRMITPTTVVVTRHPAPGYEEYLRTMTSTTCPTNPRPTTRAEMGIMPRCAVMKIGWESGCGRW